MHLVYANRRLLYRTTARSLVATAGAAPCCCGGGDACCVPRPQDDCDGDTRCCNCGTEYLSIINARVRFAYSFAGSPRRMLIDSQYQVRRRYTCVGGAWSSVVESLSVDGTVNGATTDGRVVTDTGITESDVIGQIGRTGCTPDILTLVEDASAAYLIGRTALQRASQDQLGDVFAIASRVFPVFPESMLAPLFLTYPIAGGCERLTDVTGRTIGDIANIDGPGAVYSFQYSQGCNSASYQSAGVWNIGNPPLTVGGQFSWDISAGVTIQVIRPCNPDPCTGEPPPPPPPPPPGYGACYLRDGTCLVTTAMDCFNRTFFEYRAGENCEQRRGGCSNCGQGGGL